MKPVLGSQNQKRLATKAHAAPAPIACARATARDGSGNGELAQWSFCGKPSAIS